MALRLKQGVRINGITPEMVIGVIIIMDAIEKYGNLTITACTDGKHMRGSKHYTGNAVDIRTWTIPKEKEREFAGELKGALGTNFDVVLHTTHIHVEYHPK